MKVIFLDVDGVLSAFGERGLCGARLNLFAGIVKTTGAKVVLSSTWRHPHCREQAMRLRSELARRLVELYGETPILGTSRGEEIASWLESTGCRQSIDFVILDDDPNDEMGSLKHALVKCDGYQGLTPAIASEVVRRLGVEPQPRGAGDGRGGVSGMTQEAGLWWRRLVRPIFLAMHRHGIGEIKIAKRGTKCVFELTPEGAGGGDLADGVDQGGVTAPKETVRELMLALEFLRRACEHAEGKDKHEALHLQAAMSVGCRVLAKHKGLLPDFQQSGYWAEVDALPERLGIFENVKDQAPAERRLPASACSALRVREEDAK